MLLEKIFVPDKGFGYFGFEDFYNLCRDVADFLGDEKLELAVGAHK